MRGPICAIALNHSHIGIAVKPNDPPANDHAPDAKALKRGVKKVWQALRLERRTRGKSLASDDLTQSSAVLATLAEALKTLAKNARALESAEQEASRKSKRAASEVLASKKDAEPKRKRSKRK